MEHSNFKLASTVATTSNIFSVERKAVRSSIDYMNSACSQQGEVQRGKNMEASSIEFKNKDISSVENQREKDRLFWEACLASGYP